MWAIFVLDENIRCFILLRRDRCTEKTLIHGTSPAENGFRWSIGQHMPSVNMAFSRTASLSPFATQGFGPKMVCRCKGKQLNARKPVNDCSIAPDESWVTVKISRL